MLSARSSGNICASSSSQFAPYARAYGVAFTQKSISWCQNKYKTPIAASANGTPKLRSVTSAPVTNSVCLLCFLRAFSQSSYVYGLCTRFDVGKESPSASSERSLCPTVFFFSLRTETVSLKEKHEGDNFYGIVSTRSSLNWRVGQISLTFFTANSCLGKRTHGSAADWQKPRSVVLKIDTDDIKAKYRQDTLPSGN